MDYTLEQIIYGIQKAVADALGLETKQIGLIEYANPKSGADLALPCFMLAAANKQNPAQVASELAQKLSYPAIARCEASGPYLNIWLNSANLAERIQYDIQATDRNNIQYGERLNNDPKTVVVEFPSPNMAKPFSTGHLRPSIQGWAIYKLVKAMGHNVITDDHLGDSGTPFGKWVVGFLRYSSEEKLKDGGVYELAKVYIQITKDLKEEKEAGGHEIADEVQAWLLKLEQGDPKAVELSKTFNKLSLEHIHHIYERLGIHTDHAMGEAGFVAPGKKRVSELVERGIAEKQPDGSVIVNLDGFETPMLIQKSNGAANYATTDIATLDYRMNNWHPDKIVHVVGAEQQFHFNQLFALAKRLGYTNTEFVHYWFGIIDQINDDGTRSKMSSRKGVVLLEELLDKAEEEAKSRASEAVKDDAESIRRIALGAVKFNDVAQDKKTNILFDWQTMFNLQGYSGAYIQYAAVRVGSILNKFKDTKVNFNFESQYGWTAEHDLLVCLAKYPQVVEEAANYSESSGASSYAPHKVATYLYDLARVFNRYYEQTNVSEAVGDELMARLWLLKTVRLTLEHGLDLLGIMIPEKM